MFDTAIDLSLIRDMPASIMVLDRDLRFVTASDLYLKTVGVQMPDLFGRHLFEAFPEEEVRRKPLEESIRRALAGEGNAIERLAYAIPDPADRTRMTAAWWRCRHNPLFNADGTVSHVVQITENVTDLVRTEEQRNAIAHELQHRVSNLLSLVQVIARRTAATAETVPAFLERFDERLQSMARTHSHLIGLSWDRMSISEVIALQLQHGHGDIADQITIQGPEVLLGSSEAQMLSMAIHELTTNSLKYGALRDARGRLQVSWTTDAVQGFVLDWIESGVSDLAPSGRSGFGSMILDKIVPTQLGGTARRQIGPDGLHYTITVEKRSAPV
ncbi:MAG: PAS domain S-box protein [Acetobacteraceae bacterium]|nr:MAG: PAS domain S-box protein [Acetobacteraceae bacterium]